MKDLEKLNTKIYDNYQKIGWKDGWEDFDKRFNFFHLFKIAPSFENKSILDVGCGTGDMVKYLPNTCKYLGIDIYRPALKIAKKQYPKYQFKYANILTAKLKPVDYVICSGALSIKLKTHIENYEFFTKALKKMWNLTKISLAFNILTDDRFENSKKLQLFLYNVHHVNNICRKIAPGAKISCVYTPLDRTNDQYTFYMTKKIV